MYRKSTEVMRLLWDILTVKFKAAVCPVLFVLFFYLISNCFDERNYICDSLMTIFPSHTVFMTCSWLFLLTEEFTGSRIECNFKTNWKRRLLHVGKTDEWHFRVEIAAIQLLCGAKSMQFADNPESTVKLFCSLRWDPFVYFLQWRLKPFELHQMWSDRC